jgi:hypothetical protein
MTWANERDNLIAQTKAFVQSVASPRVEIAVPIAAIRPVALENPFAIAKPVAAEHAASIRPIERRRPIEKAAEAENVRAPVALPPVMALPQSEARKEIQNRIAAFQAHQARFHRERDAYFNSVLTKARATLDQ